MNNRTQLNINIDSDFFKQIKNKSIEAEMNLGEFVNKIIKCYLTEKELETQSNFNRDRLDKIELELSNINNQLAKLKKNQKLFKDIFRE